MNYDCERPTSRVIRPPGGGSSNIFGTDGAAPATPKAKVNPNYQSNVFNASKPVEARKPLGDRHDPITGEIVGVERNAEEKKEKEEEKEEIKEEVKEEAAGENVNGAKKAAEVDASANEPRLGAVRNVSGVRCAQPPGGRSTFTFG